MNAAICLRSGEFADSSAPKTSGKPPARISASASGSVSVSGSNGTSSAPAPRSSSRFSS